MKTKANDRIKQAMRGNERERILGVVSRVNKLGDKMSGPFGAGMHMACEEIIERVRRLEVK